MLNRYSYLGIQIDRKNPHYINDFSKTLLEGHYMKEEESIPQALAKAAVNYCYGDYTLAQKIYDYAYNGWFMFASPVLSNAIKGKWVEDPEKNGAHYWYSSEFIPEEKMTGLPISCYASEIPDTAKGQVDFLQELATLSMAGGGIGAHNAIRGTSKKAPGPIPYFKLIDSAIGYFKQQGSRRGAIAAYLDVDHPDILEHIRFRIPGGDAKRKSDNRTQFHNAVNITDEFIQAVKEDKTIDLVCPHSGRIFDTFRARAIWEDILSARVLTGEPYLLKIDLANRKLPETQKALGLEIKGSNLCVSGDTLILTDKGYFPIKTLENQSINVWNGNQFSSTIVRKTGVNQELLLVKTDSGMEIKCTPYHKFYIKNDYKKSEEEKRANELIIGDKLIKNKFPIIEGRKILELAYQNGFFSGDGCVVKPGEDRIYLYHEKRRLFPLFEKYAENRTIQEDQNREYFKVTGLQSKFFVPDTSFTVKSRLEWFAGVLDADGTVIDNNDSQGLQLVNTNLNFLKTIQLMLHTLGISSKIKLLREEGFYKLPSNNGLGELKEYSCKEINRLLISGEGITQLLNLGFKAHRLVISDHKPNRNAERHIQIKEIQKLEQKEDTYCVNEPLEHKVIFNGLISGNCSEITLPTDEFRTFVCCLSSLNLELYDEWKDTTIVQDLIRFLDNVLQFFIDNASEKLAKAKFSAERERALGLGTFGWHSLLQNRNIPFESGGFNSAVQLTHEVYKLIHDRALESSKQLAKERGEAPDMAGTGLRNSRLSAIAPNANSADLIGSSPSIEPWYRNIFIKETRAGSFVIKNKALERLLESKNYNTKAIWNNILENKGSVQHLDFLTDEEKAVFKCAVEIDQHWLIELADQRGRYISQAQSLNLFFTAGMTKKYINSVHLKFLESDNVLTLYYFRTEREGNVDTVKSIERKALVDWNPETTECIACQG